ncbi:hypothetical protein [Dyella sp. EPa41]|uniref:hypothetical protein n=1 Tax=Dyella sp. EPa41 TaxID=1561194 RepID=UPI001916A64F|nr:hypothetical protein [Dyella sp. EPa41]
MASTNGRQHERSFWRGVLFATLASPLALIVLVLVLVLMMAPRIASLGHLLGGMAVIAVVTLTASRLASAGQTLLIACTGLVAGIAFCAGAKVVHRVPVRRSPNETGRGGNPAS